MSDTNLPALREAVAAYAHEAWSGWMLHLFRQGQTLVTGEYVTPKYYAERWKRQAGTPYAELPESEKDSDRAEADKILALVALPALLDELERLRSVEADFHQLSDVAGWHHGEAQIALARAEKAEADLALKENARRGLALSLEHAEAELAALKGRWAQLREWLTDHSLGTTDSADTVRIVLAYMAAKEQA